MLSNLLRDIVSSSDIAIISKGHRSDGLDLFTQRLGNPFICGGMTDKNQIRGGLPLARDITMFALTHFSHALLIIPLDRILINGKFW